MNDKREFYDHMQITHSLVKRHCLRSAAAAAAAVCATEHVEPCTRGDVELTGIIVGSTRTHIPLLSRRDI